MPVPVSQMWTVASYVVKQKLKRRKHFPVVLMLEPLMRCNLACAGCGKIQYPAHILKKELSPEECFKAVDECGAPMVSIPGGDRSCTRASPRSSKASWHAKNTFISAPTVFC